MGGGAGRAGWMVVMAAAVRPAGPICRIAARGGRAPLPLGMKSECGGRAAAAPPASALRWSMATQAGEGVAPATAPERRRLHKYGRRGRYGNSGCGGGGGAGLGGRSGGWRLTPVA